MVDLPITKWIKTKIRRLIGIVEDTDVATHSIASGKYVVWKGDLYKSTEAIAVGGTLSLSNLSPVSDGGFNELSEQIATVNNNLASYREWKGLPYTTGTTLMTLPDAYTAKEFIFVAQYGTSSGMQAMSFTFHIPNITSINGITPTQGYYRANSNAICQISVDCLNHRAYLVLLEISGGTYTSTSRLYCYYR